MTPSKYRKKLDLRRDDKIKVGTSLIIIAVEGKNTERQYFEILRDTLQDVHVTVKVLPTDDGKSAPEYVLTRLDEYYTKDFVEGDELWLMIDVDKWGPKKLSQVTGDAKFKKYYSAVSNSCFELWLLLHFDDAPQKALKSKAMETHLRKVLLGSYNKNNLKPERYTTKNIRDAIRRAKALDKNKEAPWPKEQGTHVYKVVEKLLPRKKKPTSA